MKLSDAVAEQAGNTAYAVTLTKLGFHVLHRASGLYVSAPQRGSRYINNVPTFAARLKAQAIADDLNEVKA